MHMKGSRLLSVLVLVQALIVPLCRGDLDRDREILSLLYDTTGGANWTYNEGWGVGDDLSTWFGVTFNETSSLVEELDLHQNNLRGEVPAALGNLSGCVELDLASNFLTGPIPPELGNLDELQSLVLDGNFLNGPVPVELTKMKKLTWIWLNDNDLEGGVPEEFGETELWTVSLGGNQLTGEIPSSLGNLLSMRFLGLNDNELNGTIPEEIGQLVGRGSLTVALLLQNNHLTGTVPDDIPEPDELGTTSWAFEADLSGNMLDNWPDQRDASATAPPQTSTSAADRSIGGDGGGSSASDGSSTSATDTNASQSSPPPSPSPTAAAAAETETDPASSSSPSSSPSGTTTAIAAIAGGVVGGAALLAGALIFCLVRKRRRSEGRKRGEGGGGSLPANGQDKKDGGSSSRAALSAPGKVFLSLTGGGGGGSDGGASDGDEENASYSWTRENSDMNFHDNSKTTSGGLAEVKEGFATTGAALPSSTSRSPPTAPSARLLAADAAARLRAPYSFPPVDGSSDPGYPTAATATTTAPATSTRSAAGSASSARVDPSASGSVVEGAGDVIAAALAAAEALAQDSFIPGVREAASVVAGLVRLASDHKTNARDAEKRARWCRSIVHTLERAGEVLGKAGGRDGESARVLLDDVQDSIQDMMQIMQSYRSKNMLSRVFVSSLFKKRQEEAEDGINACIQRLQLGLQVRVGHKLESVGEAVQEGLELQRRATEESGALRRRRRKQRLDQLEIPVSELEITDEVLGRGGFGTVYLADLGGLNAAAKVIVFEDEGGDDDDDDSSDDDDDDDDDHDDDGDDDDAAAAAATGADGEECGQPSRPETAESAAVAAGAAAAAAAAAAASAGKGKGDKRGENQVVSSQSHQHRQQRRAFMRELEAMKRLRGPHTVTIYGAVTSLPDRLVLVMELLPGGDLRHRLRKAKEPLDEKVMRQIVRDICCGMAFLHAKQTVHGDLKSANVLFDAAGTAKIADFGTSLWTQHTTRLATYTTKPRETVGLSLPWAAPEILNRQVSSFKSDVYSFGVVLWEILARKIPWKGVAGVDKLVLAVNAGERPPVPEDAPRDLAALASACWAHDPTARPSFKKTLADLKLNMPDDNNSATTTTAAANNSNDNSTSNNNGRRGGADGLEGPEREDSISMLLAAGGGGIFAKRKPATRSSSFAPGASHSTKDTAKSALASRSSSSGSISGSGPAASASGPPSGSDPVSVGRPVGVGFGRKRSSGGSDVVLQVLSSSSSVSSPGDPTASDAEADAAPAAAGKADESAAHISTTSTAELTLSLNSSASNETAPSSANILSSAYSSGGGVGGWRSTRSKGDAMWLKRRQQHERQAEQQSGHPPPPPYRLSLPNSKRHSGLTGSSATAVPAAAAPAPAPEAPPVAAAAAAAAATTSSPSEME